MCLDNKKRDTSKLYSWDEVRRHNTQDDKWIVIDHNVYDVTDWSHKHPGGKWLLNHFSGHDATIASKAFHVNPTRVQKYMESLCVGSLRPEDRFVTPIDQDFQELLEKVKKMGLFKSSVSYFAFYFASIIALEFLAYNILAYMGSQGWFPFLLAALPLSASMVMCLWLGHDLGHRSVWHNKWDRLGQLIVMNFIKGMSGAWWNHLHFQHHAKPNIINKDPDISVEALFVLGDVVPGEIAKKRKSIVPYNLQHIYFYIVMFLFIYPFTTYKMLRSCIVRKKWTELAWLLSFFVRYYVTYAPLFDSFSNFALFFVIMRNIENIWFTWVTQSNHLPMNIDHDRHEPWVLAQMHATCDVEGTWFNTWFSGHLNYQIEHHFFPTMPRHNLPKVVPYVKELCQKHHIPYTVKPMLTAWGDIIRSLRRSGNLWLKACHLNENEK